MQLPCVSVRSSTVREAEQSGQIQFPGKINLWEFICGNVNTSQLLMWDALILHKERFVHNKHSPFGGGDA